jgi:hypothetical protein
MQELIKINKKIINPFAMRVQKLPINDAVKLLEEFDRISVDIAKEGGTSLNIAYRYIREVVGFLAFKKIENLVRGIVFEDVWKFTGVMGCEAMYAYITSFFNVPLKYAYGKIIELWESGYVPRFIPKPVFSNNEWRLHGYQGRILWEGNING